MGALTSRVALKIQSFAVMSMSSPRLALSTAEGRGPLPVRKSFSRPAPWYLPFVVCSDFAG